MFLSILTFPIPWVLNTLSHYMRKRSLLMHLPVLAVRWFEDIERITGLVELQFNPEDVITAILTQKHTPESEVAVVNNAKWNIVWAKYCLGLLEGKFYPTMIRGFSNVVTYNSEFLEAVNEPEPEIALEPIKETGVMGYDLIAGDLVGNSYVDQVWGNLVTNIDVLTGFRGEYVEATHNPGYVDEDTALIARAIALAEIRWSNEFFPLRNVSDMWTFELLWRGRFLTGMLDNFLKAASLVNPDIEVLPSYEIIRRVAMHPDAPIETIL